MKKISVLLSAVMALSLAACGGIQNSGSSSSIETATKAAETKAESNTASRAANTDSKVLVLYFSAANTKDVDAVTTATPMVNGTSSVKWIADIIHDEVGGDIAPIIPSKDYPLEYNALADAAKAEVDNNERPAFEALEVNPADYDTIFIGYPVWWYTIPMVLETFFDKYDLFGKTIVPFNTHAGSRDGGTYKTVQESAAFAMRRSGVRSPYGSPQIWEYHQILPLFISLVFKYILLEKLRRRTEQECHFCSKLPFEKQIPK